MKPVRNAINLLVILSLFLAAEVSAEPVTEEVDKLLKEAVTARETTVGLAKLKAAELLSPYLKSDTFANKLADVSMEVRDPIVRFAILQAVTEARHELRDYAYGPDGLKGPLGQQGCLVNWQVVGPFSNDNMEGFSTRFGPENGSENPYPGALSDVNWRPLPRYDRYCVFPLGAVIQPSQSSVVYLSTTLSADSTKKASVLLGVNGAYQLWLNGEFVGHRDEDAGLGVDNDVWPVDLKKGDNQLVLKVASAQDGRLGFIARLTDRKLEPITLPSRGQKTQTPLAEAKKLTPDSRGVLARAKALSETAKGDDAVWNAWLWKRANWQNVATPWRDVGEKVLKTADKLSPRLHSLTSSLYEQGWKKLAIIEAAHKRAPKDVLIHVQLANRWEGGIEEPKRLAARTAYEETIKRHPDFLMGHLELADWYQTRGFREIAFRILNSINDDTNMRTPAYFNRYMNLYEDLGDVSKLHDLRLSALTFMALSGSMWWDLIREFAGKGEYEAALALVKEYRSLSPSSTFAGRKEATILRAMDKKEEALSLIEQLIANNPGSASLRTERAHLLLTMGKKKQAVETLRLALEQRPQDQGIRDYLSFLQPEENRFWEPWIVKDIRSYAAQTPEPSFEYDSIIDQTVIFVQPNGLSQSVTQAVERVLTADGIEAAKSHRIAYQSGDERVDILQVRVHKADGTTSEDYEAWSSGGSRKGSTTYNDTSYVNIQANNVGVGDLVEVQYRLAQVSNSNFRGDYFGDIAYLQGGRPIGFGRYAVIYPESWKLHFKVPSLPHSKIENTQPDSSQPPPGFQSVSFRLKDIPEVETDPSQPGASDVYDYILVSNKETYDEIGAWWWSLVKEQLIVDDTMKDTVKKLIKGKRTEDEKIQAIHNYVVRNTRYLHVGLGIHGWKPYRTTTAFRNRYGDCKDKAALLKVMLEEAGIPANLVLVRTRRLGKVESYPASMHVFNHAIAYVPSKNLFLDATAEFNGTTELTSMDQGAQAVVIKDGGKAEFLELPIDKPDANLLQTQLEVDLTGEKPVMKGKIVAKGANAVYFRSVMEDPERRNEVLEKQLSADFPGAKLLSAEYKNLKELEKSVEVTFVLEGGQIVRKEGDLSFLLPLVERKDLLNSYAKQSKRTQDLTIRVPFANETTVRYRIGKSATYDKIPANVTHESKFGEAKVEYRKDGDELVVDVRYALTHQRVPVAEYKEFRSFLAKVTDSLNESIRLGEEK